MSKTLTNAIAKGKREMMKFLGTCSIMDIVYGLEYEYDLSPEETEILKIKLENYDNEKLGLY